MPSSSKKTFLLNPFVDFLMIGGLSVIFLVAFIILIPDKQDTGKLGWIMFYLSFFVNFPHFLISYQFLYFDNHQRIMQDWRCFIAAVIVPSIMITWIVYFVSIEKSDQNLGLLTNLMFFFVGWHYVKQIMGSIIVSSSLKEFYFTQWERAVLLIHASSIWFISYLNSNIHYSKSEYYGIPYSTFALPKLFLHIAYGIALISFIIFAWQMLQKYIYKEQLPPFNGLVAFSTLYIWHIPILYHPGYFLMIPFFHSFQYLLFAFAYVKNRFSSLSQSSDKVQYRKKLIVSAGTYIGISFVTGALFFHFIPQGLDKWISYDKDFFGVSLFIFIFHIFLNIHHYFIDFAIWRRDNDNIRKYLFSTHTEANC